MLRIVADQLILYVCIIRYERKKNIGLAIQAFQHFKEQLPHHDHNTRSGAHGEADRVLLVVAGGYDLRVDENVEYLEVS